MREFNGNKEEAKSFLRAAVFLVKRGIDDKVYAVSMGGVGGHLVKVLRLSMVVGRMKERGVGLKVKLEKNIHSCQITVFARFFVYYFTC